MKPIKNMNTIGGLVTSALQRHGIAKQVTSAMVVEHARRFFAEKLEPQIAADLAVATFIGDVLTVDCRHPASVRLAQSQSNDLRAELTKQFPTLTVNQIFCRLRSTNFNQPEHW